MPGKKKKGKGKVKCKRTVVCLLVFPEPGTDRTRSNRTLHQEGDPGDLPFYFLPLGRFVILRKINVEVLRLTPSHGLHVILYETQLMELP